MQMRTIVSAICNRHGYHEGQFCPQCYADEIKDVPFASKDKLWDFVDYDITGKPIQITSKHQYEKVLKEHGKYQITSMKDVEIEKKRYENNMKEKHKKAIHESAVEAYRTVKQLGGDRRIIGWKK